MNHAVLSQHNVTERFTQAKFPIRGCRFSSLANFEWVLLSLEECNYVHLAVFQPVSQQTEHKYLQIFRDA